MGPSQVGVSRRSDSSGWPREGPFPKEVDLWGAFILFTRVRRAFGPGSESRLGLSVKAVGFPGPKRHGSWPTGGAQAWTRESSIEPAESGHSSPPLGAPLTPGVGCPARHQVGGRISISALSGWRPILVRLFGQLSHVTQHCPNAEDPAVPHIEEAVEATV
jgi:hypothetical protein